MRPRYLQNGPVQESPVQNRWMVSYVDVLTILLVFFIAVAARALQPAPVKPAAPQPAAVSVPLPEPDVSPAPAPAPTGLDQAQQRLEEKGLDLRREQWGLVISLPQAVLFPSGDERIQPTALPLVDEIAEVLRFIPNRVNLAGNTDSVPIHNHRFHNNWELSAARGMALLDLLASRYGIEESRLSVTSYGSFRPLDSNETPGGRAGNRRVEITVLEDSR
jgi:chemotaxis protein MotB